MKFNFKQAFLALGVSGVMMAIGATILCVVNKNYIGAIVSGIVMCGSAFVGGGLGSSDDDDFDFDDEDDSIMEE